MADVEDTLNRELFRKVEEYIRPDSDEGLRSWNPLAFDMGVWENGPKRDVDGELCGTTRCVAGWAVYATLGQPLYSSGTVDVVDPACGLSPAFQELAAELGVQADIGIVASTLLGLPREMQGLFYTYEELAAEFVHRTARGDSIESLLAFLSDRE